MRLKTLLLIIVFGSHTFSSLAQGWARTYSSVLGTGYESASAVAQTNDGGFILAGRKNQSMYQSTYIIKTDSAGHLIWSKLLGLDWYAKDIKQTIDGGFIIVGSTYNGSTSDYELLVLKTDAAGNQLWYKKFWGTHNGHEGHSVAEDNQGNIIVAGFRGFQGPTHAEGAIIKLSANGTVIWDYTYLNGNYNFFTSIKNTLDGGYIITGSSTSYSLGRAIYLLKIDSTGNLVFEKNYYQGGSTTCPCEEGLDVVQTKENEYIITGRNELLHVFLMKTDSVGNEIWHKEWVDDYAVDGNKGNALVVDQITGNIALTGVIGRSSTNDNHMLVFIKTDKFGNEIFKKTFIENYDETYGNDILLTPNKNYVIAGSILAGTNSDALLLCTDSLGSLKGILTNRSSNICRGDSIQLTAVGGDTYYWNTGDTTKSITTNNSNLYSVAISQSGNYITTATELITVDSLAPAPIITNNGNVFSSNYPNGNQWYLNGIAIPEATHQTYTITSIGNYMVKVNNGCGGDSSQVYLITNIYEAQNNLIEAEVVIYPNPFKTQTTILFSKETKNASIKIVDILGKKINEINFTGKQLILEKGAMNEGIYFLQIMEENKNIVNRKIIMQ